MFVSVFGKSGKMQAYLEARNLCPSAILRNTETALPELEVISM